MSSVVKRNIAKIREYTKQYPELLRAHHFLYDIRFNKNFAVVDFVVMGVNPGEQPENWKLFPEPTEETSEFDFLEHQRSQSSNRWRKNAVFFTDSDKILFADYFFWSSYDMKEFAKRFGPFHKSPHLGFCARMNKELISHYRPKAIISVGVGYCDLIAKIYELRKLDEVITNRSRLIIHFTDGERPWLFTKHWSGARPSMAERKTMKDYILKTTNSETTKG